MKQHLLFKTAKERLYIVCLALMLCVCVCMCSLPANTRGTAAHGTRLSFDFLLVCIGQSFCTHETGTLDSQCDD